MAKIIKESCIEQRTPRGTKRGFFRYSYLSNVADEYSEAAEGCVAVMWPYYGLLGRRFRVLPCRGER
jgi:hypothetical protein